MFIVATAPNKQPAGGDFIFAGSLTEAAGRAKAAAGGKQVHVMGGANPDPPGPGCRLAGELTIIIAPVTLSAGERLSGGFSESLESGHLGVRQSPFATFIGYRVKK